MAETWLTILGFCIGIAGYTTQSIGKGLHKLGINKIMKTAGNGNRLKKSGTWLLGTVLMTVYLVLQWMALLLVPVNMIAPLEGLGLVILLVFSKKVLGEPLPPRGIAGAALVVAGTVMCALSFEWNASIVLIVPSPIALVIFTTVIPVAGCIVVSILIKVKARIAGAGAGLVAGIISAMETISKRLSSAPDAAIIATFSALSIIYAAGSLVMNQVGYMKGTANVVVPCATSTNVIFAIVLGLALLRENVNVVQLIGMAFILPGIVLMTTMTSIKVAVDAVTSDIPHDIATR